MRLNGSLLEQGRPFFSGVGADLENPGAHALNGLASFGNAVVRHPGDVALAAAGAGPMVVSGTADAGSAVLGATSAPDRRAREDRS